MCRVDVNTGQLIERKRFDHCALYQCVINRRVFRSKMNRCNISGRGASGYQCLQCRYIALDDAYGCLAGIQLFCFQLCDVGFFDISDVRDDFIYIEFPDLRLKGGQFFVYMNDIGVDLVKLTFIRDDRFGDELFRQNILCIVSFNLCCESTAELVIVLFCRLRQ